jgi:hypothetical protein
MASILSKFDIADWAMAQSRILLIACGGQMRLVDKAPVVAATPRVHCHLKLVRHLGLGAAGALPTMKVNSSHLKDKAGLCSLLRTGAEQAGSGLR